MADEDLGPVCPVCPTGWGSLARWLAHLGDEHPETLRRVLDAADRGAERAEESSTDWTRVTTEGVRGRAEPALPHLGG